MGMGLTGYWSKSPLEGGSTRIWHRNDPGMCGCHRGVSAAHLAKGNVFQQKTTKNKSNNTPAMWCRNWEGAHEETLCVSDKWCFQKGTNGNLHAAGMGKWANGHFPFQAISPKGKPTNEATNSMNSHCQHPAGAGRFSPSDVLVQFSSPAPHPKQWPS